jgi:hypothetical protein
MLFPRKKDLTTFTSLRASYCRFMLFLIREKLHIKIGFTLIVIGLCVAFAYYNNKAINAPYTSTETPANKGKSP